MSTGTYRLSRRRFLAGTLVTGLSLTASGIADAQSSGNGGGGLYLWRLQRAKGDVLRWRARLTLTGQMPDGADFTLTGTSVSKEEVKYVAGDGTATIVHTTASQTTELNGNRIHDDPSRYPVITQVIDGRGLLLYQSIEHTKPNVQNLVDLNAVLSNIPLPDRPVKIGDSWTAQIDNRLVQGKKITLTSTLTGTEKVAGVDTLAVATRALIPPAADAEESKWIKVEGAYNVDPKTGRMMRLAFNVDNLEIAALGAAVLVKMDVVNTLIVPGAIESSGS